MWMPNNEIQRLSVFARKLAKILPKNQFFGEIDA